nr:YLP motif-containing protein [Ipomoea batatas]
MFNMQVDETEISKSAGSTEGQKTVKKVIEYCYELEMEEGSSYETLAYALPSVYSLKVHWRLVHLVVLYLSTT